MTPLNVLILCTGNSVRPVIRGRDTRRRFRGVLAGSHRKGGVRLRAHERLNRRTRGLPLSPLRRTSHQPGRDPIGRKDPAA